GERTDARLREVVVDEMPVKGLVPLHLEEIDPGHVRAAYALRPAPRIAGRTTGGQAPAAPSADTLRLHDTGARAPRGRGPRRDRPPRMRRRARIRVRRVLERRGRAPRRDPP